MAQQHGQQQVVVVAVGRSPTANQLKNTSRVALIVAFLNAISTVFSFLAGNLVGAIASLVFTIVLFLAATKGMSAADSPDPAKARSASTFITIAVVLAVLSMLASLAVAILSYTMREEIQERAREEDKEVPEDEQFTITLVVAAVVFAIYVPCSIMYARLGSRHKREKAAMAPQHAQYPQP